mmetsp:Transcript_50018/g.119452  ORF Transcript_50018/g.119452 Transcript_50018/m.119452 type:complete len:265 (-) Transcript_50018:22-816(-)
MPLPLAPCRAGAPGGEGAPHRRPALAPRQQPLLPGDGPGLHGALLHHIAPGQEGVAGNLRLKLLASFLCLLLLAGRGSVIGLSPPSQQDPLQQVAIGVCHECKDDPGTPSALDLRLWLRLRATFIFFLRLRVFGVPSGPLPLGGPRNEGHAEEELGGSRSVGVHHRPCPGLPFLELLQCKDLRLIRLRLRDTIPHNCLRSLSAAMIKVLQLRQQRHGTRCRWLGLQNHAAAGAGRLLWAEGAPARGPQQGAPRALDDEARCGHR